MSLESGLDELVGLKGLEILEVSFTKHYIDDPELEWIVKHWPKLQAAIGMFRNLPLSSARSLRVDRHEPWRVEDCQTLKNSRSKTKRAFQDKEWV